jgi:hypothetical protein
MHKQDEILIWAGLKKDITTTRKYKKLLVENESKNIEVVEEIKEIETSEESIIENVESENNEQIIKEVKINDAIKSSMRTKLFTYENLAENNNFKMISGYENRINYEGIEVKEAMHIIIYNKVSNEIIYQTGCNTRMDDYILIKYAETLLKVIEKYINDSWNLNKMMLRLVI